MIFQQIEICNLFSYHQSVIFNIAGHEKNRSIVLISGRNGFGKTGFLNSIKLLFVGPREELRRGVMVGRILGPKPYMLGNGDAWMGVFNRTSRDQTKNAAYYVRCQWVEQSGAVDVKREWFPDGAFDPEGRLTIHANFLSESLEGKAAQAFLEKRLPPAYLPFFFFDGEKIQMLAEADEGIVEKEIEGILNIAQVNTLADYLVKVKRDWARESAVDAELKKFNKLESELDALCNQLAELHASKKNLDKEIEELAAKYADMERGLRNLQCMRAQEAEARHKAELKQVQEELTRIRHELMERFVPEAPLVVNPTVMREVLDRLEQNDQELGPKKELLAYLRHHLPSELFEHPVPPRHRLREDQKTFYKERLQNALEERRLVESDGVKGHTYSLDSTRQKALRRLMTRLVDDNPMPDHARRLQEASRLARREGELSQLIEEIHAVIDEDRPRYYRMQEELRELRQQKETLLKALGGVTMDCETKAREMQRKQIELTEQEKIITNAAKNRHYALLVDRLIELFKSYKDELRKRRRESMEMAINRHFKAIMTGHDLVHHIRINEHFGRQFLDKKGDLLGGANFSAGMKQLIAIALLWAMKEVSGKTVPVIIDTPLARIDRQNQENLLREYFPNAAEQVILLPTDSELDPEKYRLLAPHVYREYRLLNPHGDRTQVEQRTMYEG
ncbi:MAG: DNA sulfur modification protein DndD [Magnetococcales bacterium]|nr:DNA sulfur modification protein DndD [Magnetococcales bacterium]